MKHKTKNQYASIIENKLEGKKMNENAKGLTKIHLNDGVDNLKPDKSNNENISPTRTILIPTIAEQRKQLSERSFKNKNPRRNSTIIDRQTIQKQARRTSKTDVYNLSLNSSNGSVLPGKSAQKTLDSLADDVSNHCIIKTIIFFSVLFCFVFFFLNSYFIFETPV